MSIRSKVEVALDAGEVGWVRFNLTVGDSSYVHDVSDLTDVLGDLLRAALSIACGAERAGCAFDLEPGTIQFQLERGHGDPMVLDALRLTVTEGSDDRPVFLADCASETFAEAICLLADGIHALGAEAYHDRWGQPFPTRPHAALRVALATPG